MSLKRPPKTGNEYVANCLADEYAIRCFQWNAHRSYNQDTDKDELDEIKEELEEFFLDSLYLSDGYKLAKALDDRYSWDGDEELVDIMSGVDSSARVHYKKVISDWITAYNITPQFKETEYVNFKWGGKFKGHITKIDLANANYHINKDGDPSNRNCIVPYEDVGGLVNA